MPATLVALVEKKPEPEVIIRIQNMLDDARALQNSDNRKKLVKIEMQFGLRDSEGHWRVPPLDTYADNETGRRNYLRALQNFEVQHREAIRSLLASDQVEDYAAVVQAHRIEMQEADNLREQAVAETIDAFGLASLAAGDKILSGPPNTTDPNRVPGHIGEAAEWTLTFSERMPDNRWGETDTSGHTVIGPEAFKNVARLAYTLDHEGRHYRDFTTPDKELWNEPGNEVRLRNETKKVRDTIFGLSKEDIAQQDLQMWVYRKNAALWTLMKKWEGLDPYNVGDRRRFPGVSGVIPGHSSLNERLESIKQEALELEAQVEREAAERKAARQKEESDRLAREERESQARQAARDRASALVRIAYKACHDPDRLGIADLNSFDWESPAPIGDYPGLEPAVLESTCVGEVFEILRQIHSSPSLEDIQYKGRIRYQCKYRINMARQLADLTQRACNRPEALSSENIEEVAKCFPFGSYGPWDGGPDCAHDLYRAMLVKSKMPSWQWLSDEARRLNQKYAPPPPSSPPPSPPSILDPDPEPRDRTEGRKRCLDPDPSTGLVGCPP
ncbi:MAG: hypothetical protein PHU21_06580 [Elusimicrobia bacterium]|nr:hypothetical protein [Elusimicrobiota bacterium]